MRHRLIAASATLLLAVTACTAEDSDPSQPPAPTASATEAPDTISTEGPADKPAELVSGVTIKLVKLEKLDPQLGDEVPTDQTIVRVTMAVTNTTVTPIPLSETTEYVDIYAGESGIEGKQVTGRDVEDPAKRLGSKDPKQIPPDTTQEIFRSRTVPTAELGKLAVKVTPPTLEAVYPMPYTFTGAEKLLR